MEIVVLIIILALAVVLIAGGLFLSRRSARSKLGESPGAPPPPRPERSTETEL